MYEDASIEVSAFRPGGRVLCIASAGCTAIQLASQHEVVAIDINPAQLRYAGLRFAGQVSATGSAERLLALGRCLAPLAGWRSALVQKFVELEDPAEQLIFWQRHLDTRRFRTAFDGLLSLTALRAAYSPAFLDFLPARFGAVLRSRMERCFGLHANRTNPYARALLLGELAEDPVPAQAKDIRLVRADAATFLEQAEPGSFDGFALSNILDGAESAYQQRLIRAVGRAAAPNAVLVLRSFRNASTPLPTNHAAEDRSMLWGIVDVRHASITS
jgi:S-adenosylmethionine:diacylglycerol 3-amino-3-carboxypropyl transferase